jgi:hypothetical protein
VLQVAHGVHPTWESAASTKTAAELGHSPTIVTAAIPVATVQACSYSTTTAECHQASTTISSQQLTMLQLQEDGPLCSRMLPAQAKQLTMSSGTRGQLAKGPFQQICSLRRRAPRQGPKEVVSTDDVVSDLGGEDPRGGLALGHGAARQNTEWRDGEQRRARWEERRRKVPWTLLRTTTADKRQNGGRRWKPERHDDGWSGGDAVCPWHTRC